MVESGGWKAVRAVVIGCVALATTSVVLWPLAVCLLPLLFWAACGGRFARWSASAVAAVVVFVAAEVGAWVLVRKLTGAPPANGWWMVALAAVVAPATLAAFLAGSRRIRERKVFSPTTAPGRRGASLA